MVKGSAKFLSLAVLMAACGAYAAEKDAKVEAAAAAQAPKTTWTQASANFYKAHSTAFKRTGIGLGAAVVVGAGVKYRKPLAKGVAVAGDVLMDAGQFLKKHPKATAAVLGVAATGYGVKRILKSDWCKGRKGGSAPVVAPNAEDAANANRTAVEEVAAGDDSAQPAPEIPQPISAPDAAVFPIFRDAMSDAR